MNLMARKYIKTAIMFWGLCLVILVPVVLLVIKPQMERIKSLRNQYNEKNIQTEKIKVETEESTILELQKKIDNLKAEYDRFVVPSQSAIQTLALIEIDKMCKDIGLDAYIDPWNSGEVQAFSECKYVRGQLIKVTFNATFNEFAKLLNNLERFKSVIFIDGFSVTKSQENEGKQRIEMSLAVLVAKPQKGSQT